MGMQGVTITSPSRGVAKCRGACNAPFCPPGRPNEGSGESGRPFAAICVLYHSVFSDCVMSRPATASESAIGGIWLGEERVRLEEGARLEKRTKYTRPIFRTVVLRVRP